MKNMNSSAATVSATATAVAGRRMGRGPLFRAVERAAREGVSRHAFAMRTGLTTAEVVMVERASGISLGG